MNVNLPYTSWITPKRRQIAHIYTYHIQGVTQSKISVLDEKWDTFYKKKTVLYKLNVKGARWG